MATPKPDLEELARAEWLSNTYEPTAFVCTVCDRPLVACENDGSPGYPLCPRCSEAENTCTACGHHYDDHVEYVGDPARACGAELPVERQKPWSRYCSCGQFER